jgi:hypothetical protein
LVLAVQGATAALLAARMGRLEAMVATAALGRTLRRMAEEEEVELPLTAMVLAVREAV